MLKTWIAALAAAGLAGCQSFKSTAVDVEAGAMPHGLHYAVPKALMTIELQQKGGRLWLGVSRPFLVGDPQATYSLSSSSGLFADQRYKLYVNPQTRLLDYINSVSQGQATQILTNLAKAGGALQGTRGDFKENSLGAERGAIQVFSKVFDPLADAGCNFGQECNLTQLGDEIHAKAREFLNCDVDAGPNLVRCRELGEVNKTFSISIKPMFEVVRSTERSRRAAQATSCSSSICYRAPVPYLMRVYVKGSRDVSEVVMLPNQAPIMSMDLPAGVFATARSRVDLVQGMPARIEVEQGNELVGITAIPLTIVQGFFDAVGSVFQLRINYNSQYEDMLESDLAKRQAQDNYNAAMDERDAARSASGSDPEERSGEQEDIGIAPENSLEYLEPDAEIVDQGAIMNATILAEPEAPLFSVPLQPEDTSREDRGGGTQGLLDGTDSEDGGEAPQ